MKRAVLGGRYLIGAAGLMFAAFVLLAADASPTATPAATPPPGLDIQVTASRPSVTRNDPVEVFIVVKNKASTPITGLRVSVPNDQFLLTKPSFPSPLPGFASAEKTATIEAKPTAQFVQHQVLFNFTYTTSVDGHDVDVIQGSPIALQVTRRFDEESKGFLGGNAAFLYLLLPIIPLFLGYQLVDHRIAGGKFELPSFKTENIVPAFLLAVLLNLLLLFVFRLANNADYSDPPVMFAILVGSFFVGMIAAGIRWLGHYLLLLPWTYREGDSPADYLRKALLGPGAPKTPEWVEGRDTGGEPWAGILLKQPSGAYALGATFQIAPAGQAPTREQLKRDVFDANNQVRDDRLSRKRLVELLKSGGLNATYRDKVVQGSDQRDTPVVTKLDGFQRNDQPAASKPFVLLVT